MPMQPVVVRIDEGEERDGATDDEVVAVVSARDGYMR